MVRSRCSISMGEATRCRKPLLAYDGSPSAERALDVAVDLASGSHSRLTILCAVFQIPALACLGAAPEAVSELRKSFLTDAERLVCRAVERVPRGIPVTKLVSSQPIEQALLRQAIEGDHDLVILGSRGRGPLRSLIFGSVSRTALRRCPLPVLIVRPTPGEAPEADQGLLQVPGSEDARAVGGDGHRELEVGGEGVIRRVDGPAV
jgi:nucleotide-binding universal stress UspA family protein